MTTFSINVSEEELKIHFRTDSEEGSYYLAELKDGGVIRCHFRSFEKASAALEEYVQLRQPGVTIPASPDQWKVITP